MKQCVFFFSHPNPLQTQTEQSRTVSGTVFEKVCDFTTPLNKMVWPTQKSQLFPNKVFDPFGLTTREESSYSHQLNSLIIFKKTFLKYKIKKIYILLLL